MNLKSPNVKESRKQIELHLCVTEADIVAVGNAKKTAYALQIAQSSHVTIV